ncbi:MAG: signal peptide peptidase SppA [Leptotrichiaceae bacterium]|jgi:protease-4|nr:signal peptide peptidase SppA [Leptotrichiaceae bacterium]MBP6167751.1 signal peptide peptidase SppA [Leptotrichiaceae bacterium]MBP7026304.1 signal peptide peptidase SppA [Leptotrichiaceae bacterium]
MNLTKIVKQFLIFTLKEIYSFFLKLFLFFALLALLIIIVSVAVVSKQKESINNNYSYIMLSPTNLTDDKLQTNLLKNAKQNISFRDLTIGIETAAKDQKIKGIIIDLDRVLLTSSNIEELTPKLEAFKKANKKIYAYGSYIDNQNYSLALNADEIIMVPSSSASISITGYHYSNLYMKKLFDNLGINFEVIHIGDYKSYGENYNKETMSDGLKSELTRILDTRLNTFTKSISQNRKLDLQTINTKLLNGDLALQTPFSARDNGLIDKLEYFGQFLSRIGAKEEDVIDIYSYLSIKTPLKEHAKDKIAIIYAEGPITYLETSGGDIVITPENISQKLSELNKISNLKGVVLRVNSPGGSALGAEMIYKALSDIQVPIYVSMGSTAASGGYYISMSGDKIFADKSTITGSIGVVSILPKVNKGAEKYGVNSSSINKGKYSDVYDPFTPLDDDSRNKITQSMTETYKEFKSRVTTNRKISDAKLETLAQGRIWLGEEAKSNGLVDEIGSLDDTIKALAKTLNLTSYEVIDVYSNESFNDLISRFLGRFGASISASASAPAEIIKVMDKYKFVEQNNGKPLYYLPYDVSTF